MSDFNNRNFILLLFLFLGCLPQGLFADSSNTRVAPDFSLPRLSEEGTVNLKDLKGQVVYLDFWATWCPPCRKSFPWMEKMHKQYHDDGLTIVAVSIDAKAELAEKFIQDLKPSFIIAHDPAKKTPRLYKLRAMPSSYLIDRNGNIISTHLGFRSNITKKLEANIRDALKQ